MSHFTVLVIGPDPEKQLAPYRENNYEKDEVTGKYGYWKNPNAKWDWYQLGGRWRGFFKLKHPNQETVVGSDTFDNSPKFDSDQALKKDIDFEGMEETAGQRAKEDYEMVEKLFGGEIPKIDHLWKDIINEKNEKYNKMNYDEKREFYLAQPALIKKEELRKQCWPKETNPFSKKESDWLTWSDLDNYQCSKEEFIQKAKAKAFVTFAVIKDGKWYERGEMGGWGCVSNKMEKDEWCNKFYTLIHDLPDDTLLSVYDCHI